MNLNCITLREGEYIIIIWTNGLKNLQKIMIKVYKKFTNFWVKYYKFFKY